MARVVALLAGLDDVPGVTVNRYCSSSLQTIRMAAHAIRAGEGDVFVAAGVETVSRFQYGAADTGPHNPLFAEAEARTAARAPKVDRALDPARGPARRLHRHGPDGRERGRVREGQPRRSRTSSPCCRRPGPWRPRSNGFFEREIIPVTLADGTVVTKDDGPRAGTTLEGLAAAEAGVPRGRDGHRRQRLPAQRRGRRRRRHERHPGRASWASPRWPGSWPAGSPASTPRSWASDRSRPAARPWRRAGMTIDDIDLVEINEAFAAQVVPSARTSASTGTSSTSTAGPSPSATPSARPGPAS